MHSIPEDTRQGAVRRKRALALGCKRLGTSRKAVARGVAPLGTVEGHSRRARLALNRFPTRCSLRYYQERVLVTGESSIQIVTPAGIVR